ncbi:MAG: radical SAM protein [Candidatus Muiribacteriota bacterium]
MKYVFGPVASRRLGASLGVDLLYNTICSFDCIYCECGKTSVLSTQRKSYVPPEKVIQELEFHLKDGGEKNIDFVTFSGSGEPTLSIDIGKIIKYLKTKDVNTALLTNSTMLWQKEVRDAVRDIDVIVPTLNTVNDKTLKLINCPSPHINIDKIKDGLKKFSAIFKNQMFIEILFCSGLNDTKKELQGLCDFLKEFQFTKVQLNTVVRPPAYSKAKPCSKNKMQEIKNFFTKEGIKSEIIGLPAKVKKQLFDENQFLNTISIRPMTYSDIENLFKKKDIDIDLIIQKLIRKRKIFKKGEFYFKK